MSAYTEAYKDYSPIDDVREFVGDDGILYECTYKGNEIWKVEESELLQEDGLFVYDNYFVVASEFASTRTLMLEITDKKGFYFNQQKDDLCIM